MNFLRRVGTPERILKISLAVSFFLGANVPHALALNCNEARQLMSVYFKMHFSYHSFDDELSRRTLDNFVKSWDPSKVYFLQADIDRMEKDYSTKLDEMIPAGDCSAIDDIVNTYSKRFAEAQKMIFRLIDDKVDFNVDEYLEIERKTMPYAKTTEEIQERWRKRVKFQLLQLKDTLKDLPKARAKLQKRYQLAAKRQTEVTSDNVYAALLNAFSSALDPHSEYLAAERLEDFRIQTRLSLEGIGAVLRSDDGFTIIQSLVPGGAASKTGKIKVDDKIIAVAQGKEAPVDVIDMDLRDVVKLIRGTRATEVRLTLLREESDRSTQVVVPVIREEIQLNDKAAKSKVIDVKVSDAQGPAGISTLKIGVVSLPSFYMDFEGRQAQDENFRSSSRDMLKEITSLKSQNVDGIIVDLRNNGGGSLDESINVAGLFIDKGPVVQIKRMEGSVDVQNDKDPKVYYDGPLVVLINRQSASASEIFAGAVQDYARGLIVGDQHTFGKGTVQNLNDITEKLGAIKVTISKFYRPSGSSTQLRGVESDMVLPDLWDEYEIGEKHYDYALPWEKIKSSDFKPVNMTQEYLPALKSASLARIAKDKGFIKMAEEIKKFRANKDERSRVSLKEGGDKKDKDKKGDSKKAKLDDDGEESGEQNLADDTHLQESLRIMGDYVQLMRKKPLGLVSIPALANVSVADSKKGAKAPEVSNAKGPAKQGKAVKANNAEKAPESHK